MRVLFVIANLANGGAERVLASLSSHLGLKNEIHIAVLERDMGFYEFDKSINFHHLSTYDGGKILSKIKKVAKIRALFKELKPDLIISFIDWTNVVCVAANLGLNFKHIATEHHANEYLVSPKFRLIRDMAYRRVSGLSVLSKSDFEYYSFVKNREILHNPFALKSGQNLEKENIILSVGRLEAVKGYDIYFKALAKIDKGLLLGWKVQIAGDGSLAKELKDMTKDLGLDVQFLGHVSDIAPLYQRAKIFVISSRSEGLSNVLIEAGNFGCVRVSSDTVGGLELIKNGINGVLFENGNDDELASMLTEILQDSALQSKIGEQAKRDASEFSQEKIMAKWDKFIDRVMKK
ncbi:MULTISPECIES: glycosyltransferase [unclassified Campylobacter]|uniref:glycosyltransferase n=1 Tax=unclassified Campylobacter TaxID=2593542 RepID=UPI003D33CEDC